MKNRVKKEIKKLNKRSEGFFTDFKKFITKGNVLDLAVAVVMATAFNAIVSGLVKYIITPLITYATSGVSINEWEWVIREAVTDAAGKRTVKIGGRANDNGKSYVLHFVHKDATDGDVRVTIVGKNQAGFSLAFAKDKETVVDAEFKAQPHDSDGTLIRYEEETGNS